MEYKQSIKMIYNVVNFLVLFLLLQEVSCSKENDKAILSQMQDWGKAIFTSIEPKETKGQYLVASLLPVSALDKPLDFSKILFKGCPERPNSDEKMIECSTSAVILNKESEELWKRSPWREQNEYKDHKWHGEYRLLNGGIIERLVDNFYKENGREARCMVFLYSFYIPCADIQGCPYWCSNEIALYNNRNGITCKITTIGYTEVFRRSNEIRTNEDEAKDALKTIEDLFHTVRDVKSYAIEEVKNINQPKSFQELMYNCLLNSPLSGCCVDNTDSRTNSELVIAYFVNNMVYEALERKKMQNEIFSPITSSELNKYFRDYWIKRKLHTDCTKCPVKMHNALVVSFCSKTALDFARGFSSPASDDYSLAQWGKPGETFKNLYSTPPNEFLKTKMVMCADRPLSMESLCTRRTEKMPNIHSSMMQGPSAKRSKLGDNRGVM